MATGSGRPIYEPNPAATDARHEYEIEKLKKRLAPPPGLNPRIVTGGFYGDSITNPGSGDWTIELEGDGVRITFDPPFAAPPVVNAMAGAGNDYVNGVPIANGDTDGEEFEDHVHIDIQDLEGNNVDVGNNGWYFTAIGLPAGVDVGSS